MQTSSMSMIFGPKILPCTHKVTLYHKARLSLIPRRLLQNQTLPRKPTKQDSFHVMATSSDLENESTRPLAQFTPTFLGDHHFSVPVDDSEFDAIEHEIESVMKPCVRDMLMSSHTCAKEKICLIHLLISLAISHYFENEIEEILNKAFGDLEILTDNENDLETISIMFEVFRLYGHKMPCDVFERFKGEHDGKFKESVVRDVRGMLQLYQASYLKTKDEDIMEEARSFTRTHLLVTTTHPHLAKLIQHVLHIPRYRCIEIVVAREYISFYKEEEDHDVKLLKFAKLNFSYCQLHYIKELKALTKWWKEMDLASKLPYTFRDRLAELCLGIMGTYFEPRYSLARVICTKISMIMTVVDDTYDAYGTLPEVTSFTDALQRWDIGTIEDLPSYMQILFRNLWETMKEIEREMSSIGRADGVQPTIDEIKSLTKEGYLEIAKWARTGHVPSFEEYMEVGVVTAGMDDMAVFSFLGMEVDGDEKILMYEWVACRPKYIQAFNVMVRLTNDIATFEEELKRGEVANGVNCYMKQHGVTQEEAVTELKKMIKDHHEIMMEEFFKASPTVPRQILVRVFNLARVIHLFYKEGDGFGHPGANLKDQFTSLFT